MDKYMNFDLKDEKGNTVSGSIHYDGQELVVYTEGTAVATIKYAKKKVKVVAEKQEETPEPAPFSFTS